MLPKMELRTWKSLRRVLSVASRVEGSGLSVQGFDDLRRTPNVGSSLCWVCSSVLSISRGMCP